MPREAEGKSPHKAAGGKRKPGAAELDDDRDVGAKNAAGAGAKASPSKRARMKKASGAL